MKRKIPDTLKLARAEIIRLRKLLRVVVKCGACGRCYVYNRADDKGGQKAFEKHHRTICTVKFT